MIFIFLYLYLPAVTHVPTIQTAREMMSRRCLPGRVNSAKKHMYTTQILQSRLLGPFHNRTHSDRLNTRHVRYSDPHCLVVILQLQSSSSFALVIKYNSFLIINPFSTMKTLAGKRFLGLVKQVQKKVAFLVPIAQQTKLNFFINNLTYKIFSVKFHRHILYFKMLQTMLKMGNTNYLSK